MQKILIVEDDIDIQDILKNHLIDAGYQDGNEVVLTSKEFALLRLMLENQGKVFTRQMLLDRLWAEDLEVEDRIVDSHIKNIRKKLNVDYIKTIRGVGYRIDKVH